MCDLSSKPLVGATPQLSGSFIAQVNDSGRLSGFFIRQAHHWSEKATSWAMVIGDDESLV
jgi:hypothetical protein